MKWRLGENYCHQQLKVFGFFNAKENLLPMALQPVSRPWPPVSFL
jgi:hypothetical protein